MKFVMNHLSLLSVALAYTSAVASGECSEIVASIKQISEMIRVLKR